MGSLDECWQVNEKSRGQINVIGICIGRGERDKATRIPTKLSTKCKAKSNAKVDRERRRRAEACQKVD